MKRINFEPVVLEEHHMREKKVMSILVYDEQTLNRNQTMTKEERQRLQLFSPSYEEDMWFPQLNQR
jgi:hypothetical protein